jgi:hypothetical protein
MACAMRTRGTFGCAEHGQRAAQVGLYRGVGVIPCVTRISSDVISLTSDDIVSMGSRSAMTTDWVTHFAAGPSPSMALLSPAQIAAS